MQVARHVAKTVLFNALGYIGGKLRKAAKDPGVGRRLHARFSWRIAFQVHTHKARGIPDFRNKTAGSFSTRRPYKFAIFYVGVETYVLVIGNQRKQVKAHGISAIHVNKVHGVYAIALGLGHTAAIFRQNGCIDNHIFERNLLRKIERAHNHASNPECNNVTCGNQGLCGMMPFHFL